MSSSVTAPAVAAAIGALGGASISPLVQWLISISRRRTELEDVRREQYKQALSEIIAIREDVTLVVVLHEPLVWKRRSEMAEEKWSKLAAWVANDMARIVRELSAVASDDVLLATRRIQTIDFDPGVFARAEVTDTASVDIKAMRKAGATPGEIANAVIGAPSRPFTEVENAARKHDLANGLLDDITNLTHQLRRESGLTRSRTTDYLSGRIKEPWGTRTRHRLRWRVARIQDTYLRWRRRMRERSNGDSTERNGEQQ